MSSLARRSLRTTATAAGIAAIGVGLAGNAFAAPAVPTAPELPATPGADALTTPDAASAPEALADLQSAAPSAEAAGLPELFSFEMPNVETQTAPESTGFHTAGLPEAPSAPSAPEFGTEQIPSNPATDAFGQFGNADAAGQVQEGATDFAGSNNVGPSPSADSATMFAELAQQAANGTQISGHSIGQ
ncbi:hypothetical protein ACVGVM_00095 [Pseudonocardia bannensis]|uniref:Uncharacterized protein n=1 Tax=Pseudonocardia bannensis TaxID=630973 RepID=A0A848DG22_9PSEU|nr:hypothetical protein [Pseudonocardia bannensis]NMH91504.1 hypothetical protein [Pseudonocardia bannensis]